MTVVSRFKRTDFFLFFFLFSISSVLNAESGSGTIAPLSYTHDGLEVTIIDCDTTYIGAVVVPALIEGLPVTMIGDSAFRNCSSITEVTLPDSVEQIGDYAFKTCTALSQFSWPSNLSTIGLEAFRDCRVIESIVLPDTVVDVGDRAFERCYALNSITLSGSLVSIGEFAFKECIELDAVTLPAGLSILGDGAFSACIQLQAIGLEAGNLSFSLIDGVLFDASETTLVSFPSGRSGTYVIPEGVTGTQAWAFNVAPYLEAVEFPSTFVTLGEGSFSSCRSLVNLVIPEGVTTIPDFCFSQCRALETLSIPSTVTSISPEFYRNASALRSITVDPGNVYYTSQNGVLLDLVNSALVRYPPNKSGDTYAVPAGIVEIGDSAFEDSLYLEAISLPDGLTRIGTAAMLNCESLRSICIPDTVTTIDTFALSSGNAWTAIYFLGDAPGLIEVNAFSYNPALTVYFFEGASGFTSPEWTYTEFSDPVASEELALTARTSMAEWMLTRGYLHDEDIEQDGHSGFSILEEYAFDIGFAGSALLPSHAQVGEDFELTFYAGRSDINYTVERSSNLTAWETTGVTLSPIDAEGYRTASMPIENKGFMQVSLQLITP